MTHTYAELEISPAAYAEISQKLRDAGYDQAFDGLTIDMQGIALIPGEPGALDDIRAERVRQIHVEGFDREHDREHDAGELAAAATCYAINAACVLYPHNGTPIEDIDDAPVAWPFGRDWWKPTTPRRDLVKAGALIVAELERMGSDDSST